MKKIIVLLLSLCMLASLYGCGKKALVEKKYEAAFSNALEYMQNSPPFERVREIEPERVEVEEGLIDRRNVAEHLAAFTVAYDTDAVACFPVDGEEPIAFVQEFGATVFRSEAREFQQHLD